MTDSAFAPDEWDPPQLNAHMPFPPPVAIDLDVFDSAPFLLFNLYAVLWFRGWHQVAPAWFWWVVVSLDALWVINTVIRPQGRRLLAWLPIVLRYVLLAARAPFLAYLHPDSSNPEVHVEGRWSFLLARDEGRKRVANVTILPDGVLDTSAGSESNRVVRFVRWALAVATGHEPLVQLVWVSDTGALDLLDPEARMGVWAARQELVARPDHRMSLYLRVRAFPEHDVLMAAGELGTLPPDDLREWIATLVQRRLLLAIPAARRRVLRQRALELLGVGDQPGKLGRAGLYGQLLAPDEVRTLCVDAWGPDFRPTIGVTPTRVEVETGASDPPPIADAPDQPRGGNPGIRRLCTYTITGVLDTLYVGWLEPLTGRRLHCDVAMHIEPIRDSWAEMTLGLKAIWWGRLAFGADKYALATSQAQRTVNLIRRRKTSAIRFGLYATVPETQTPTAELALREMVGRHNFKVAALESVQARMATEPTGRDPLNQRWWTDSQTVAAAWPGTGGIWVDGCVLIGECPRSNEPIGWNPWWEGDETSVGVIFGRSGSGKTVLQMSLIGRMLRPHPEHWLARRPPPAIVAYLKPYDEWEAFCRYYHGEHYHMAADPSRGVDWRWALRNAALDAPIVAFNIIDLPDLEQVAFMSELEHWVEAHQAPHRFKHPLLYVIGEAWAWAQDPQMAKHLQKYALQVRAMGIGLLVDTQRVQHFLNSAAADLPEQASMWCLMRLRTSEREILAQRLDLGEEAVRILAQIDQPNTLSGGIQIQRGRGIIEAHGIRSTLQVKRFGNEVGLLDQTNPRLRDEAWFAADDNDDGGELLNGRAHNVGRI